MMITGDDDDDNQTHNYGRPPPTQCFFLPDDHDPASGSHENFLPGCTDLVALESHQHLETFQRRGTTLMMFPDWGKQCASNSLVAIGNYW